MPQVLHGIGVCPGAVVGPVIRLAPPPPEPAVGTQVEIPELESERALAALAEVASLLRERGTAVGGTAEGILEAEAMMAEDPELHDRVVALVGEGRSAARAVHEGLIGFADTLRALGGYLGERVADLDDLRFRAIALLTGVPMPGVPFFTNPSVLVAHDLAPADTAVLDPAYVLGFVTELGGPTSHTAILAKQLGIPAVVGCAAAGGLDDGVQVVVDGSAGEVVVDPPESIRSSVAARAAARAASTTPTGPGRTADGAPVGLLVNVGTIADALNAATFESEGVGLFRTEVLYLKRTTAPPVDVQIEAYRAVFDAFAGKKVVIRTLDAGADKPLPFVHHGHEANPALGVRGLRVARQQPELLKDQLAAIAEASYGSSADVWVMAPMVSTSVEAAEFVDQARAFGLATVGAMIEVPAAALRTERLLRHCDFVSIGTNDLAQYTLAADRMEAALADLLDIWQPALIDLVAAVAEGGSRAGRPVGVCGEAASDPLLALVLVGLGVTSLSMAPSSLPSVRRALAAHTLDQCREMAAVVRDADDAVSARAAVRSRVDPDLMALL
ncbi:MAG TPA: phosphoenolpyruvate--protein phosphotransferase [Blastococcus sp.]